MNNFHMIFYPTIILSLLLLLAALANPYRMQMRIDQLINATLSEDVQEDLLHLTDAWAGAVKVTRSQIRMMSLLGATLGVVVAMGLAIIIAPALAILMGFLVGAIGAYYPSSKFEGGYPKSLLYNMEREAALLAGAMYRSRGVAGMSVQNSFQSFSQYYPDTETAKILEQIPDSVSVTKSLIGLRLPSSVIPNWGEVVSTMDTISEMGNPEEALLSLRDRVQEREVQYLRGLAKKKAFQAPIVTVMLLLLPLMGLILIPIMVEAAKAIGGI